MDGGGQVFASAFGGLLFNPAAGGSSSSLSAKLAVDETGPCTRPIANSREFAKKSMQQPRNSVVAPSSNGGLGCLGRSRHPVPSSWHASHAASTALHAEHREMVARARVIARKVWFLRHGALCLEPAKCSLGPCAKAVQLVTHMRKCGAIADPKAGCRDPSCVSAARLLHHPRTCKRDHCDVCSLVRRAGTRGHDLLLHKDFRATQEEAHRGRRAGDNDPTTVGTDDATVVTPTTTPTGTPPDSQGEGFPHHRQRRGDSAESHDEQQEDHSGGPHNNNGSTKRPRAYSEVPPRSPRDAGEDDLQIDADGFAVPAPRMRKRSFSGASLNTLSLLHAAASPSPHRCASLDSAQTTRQHAATTNFDLLH